MPEPLFIIGMIKIFFFIQKEEQRLKEADSYVKKEIKSFANRIQPQDLEAAILDVSRMFLTKDLFLLMLVQPTSIHES